MAIDYGSMVKIIKVLEPRDNVAQQMVKAKRPFIGKEGVVYSNGHPYKDSGVKTGLPNGELVFVVKDEKGKELSPYVWFESELKELK